MNPFAFPRASRVVLATVRRRWVHVATVAVLVVLAFTGWPGLTLSAPSPP